MISFRVWLMSFVLGGLISAPSAEALMQPQASNPRITLKNDGASPLFIYQIEDEDFDQLIAEIEPGTARSLELPPGELHQICTQATVFAEFTTGTVDPTVWSLLDGTQPFAEIHVGGLPDATISAAHLATLWNKGFDARGTWISPDGLKLFVVSGSDEGMMIDVRWPSVTQAWRLTRVAGQDRLFELVSVVEADGTVSTTLPSGKANLRFIGVAEAILTTGGAEDRYLRSTGDALDASWQRPVQLHVGNERFDTIELQELPARKGPRPRAAEEQSLQTTVITAGDSAVITAAAGTKLSVVVQGGDDLGVIEASSLPRQEIAVGYRWIAHSAWPNSRALQAAASNTASPTGAYSLTLKTSNEPTAGTDSKLEVRFCGADDIWTPPVLADGALERSNITELEVNHVGTSVVPKSVSIRLLSNKADDDWIVEWVRMAPLPGTMGKAVAVRFDPAFRMGPGETMQWKLLPDGETVLDGGTPVSIPWRSYLQPEVPPVFFDSPDEFGRGFVNDPLHPEHHSRKGYNVLRMNPANLLEKGTVSYAPPVFRPMDPNSLKYRLEGGYRVPHEFLFSDVPQAATQSTTQSYFSESERRKGMSVGVSGNVQVGPAKIGASAEHSTERTILEGSGRVSIVSSKFFSSYWLTLVKARARLHPQFIEWVMTRLPGADEGEFKRFFETFGTHYPLSTLYGGKAMQEALVLTEKFAAKATTTTGGGVDVNGIGGKVSVSDMESLRKEDESKKERAVFLGGDGTNFDTWSSGSEKRFAPIRVDLHPIWELIRPELLPGFPRERVIALQSRMKSMLDEYLRQGAADAAIDAQPRVVDVTIEDLQVVSGDDGWDDGKGGPDLWGFIDLQVTRTGLPDPLERTILWDTSREKAVSDVTILDLSAHRTRRLTLNPTISRDAMGGRVAMEGLSSTTVQLRVLLWDKDEDFAFKDRGLFPNFMAFFNTYQETPASQIPSDQFWKVQDPDDPLASSETSFVHQPVALTLALSELLAKNPSTISKPFEQVDAGQLDVKLSATLISYTGELQEVDFPATPFAEAYFDISFNARQTWERAHLNVAERKLTLDSREYRMGDIAIEGDRLLFARAGIEIDGQEKPDGKTEIQIDPHSSSLIERTGASNNRAGTYRGSPVALEMLRRLYEQERSR